VIGGSPKRVRSVGLFLELGRLGFGTQQTWVFRSFTAAEGTQAALDFSNAPARLGPGRPALTLATT
jgi:hypothetical protein